MFFFLYCCVLKTKTKKKKMLKTNYMCKTPKTIILFFLCFILFNTFI